jgi:hypothetical protein
MEEIESEGEHKDVETQQNGNGVLFSKPSNQILEPSLMVVTLE